DVVRGLAIKRRALAGVHRLTFARLVGLLAAEQLAARGLAPATGLAATAIAARAVHHLAPTGALAHFAPVLDRPGFAGALAKTITELRLNGIGPAHLSALDGGGAAIGQLLRQFDAELADARLADRAAILDAARLAVSSEPAPQFAALPTLLLDVAIEGTAERDFIAALGARAPDILATVPAGDERTLALLEDALGVRGVSADQWAEPSLLASTSLATLTRHLFAESAPVERAIDESVTMTSAPGEMHECVEIARRIMTESRRRVAFDRIAVLLHDAVRYSPYLKEALARAGVPAYFVRATESPEPGGRALLALLACKADNYSARRFAEYLSLAQLPDHDMVRASGDAPQPDTEFGGASLAPDLELPPARPDTDSVSDDPLPIIEGTVRAPWRWERLIVDASVICGADRWRRRIDGLGDELRRRRRELDDDDAHARAIDRQIIDLAHLKAVAIEQIGALESLPKQATWGAWLEQLRALVAVAIRDAAPLLAALAELEPMGPVGPVGLDEVRLVLGDRLGRLDAPPSRRRYGAVFVAPPHLIRGMSFDVVLVAGLAERVFPRKHVEDPILGDTARARLSPHLARQENRVASERLALRLAAGAARERVVFSYPRVDVDQGRPRVPSFYALEILRAAEGRLPGFDELSRRAASEQVVRLGWPAPADPADAIDDAEFDLAVLDGLIDADPDTTTGAAHYLLNVNPHLTRALRVRARRWLRRWTPADGLVDPSEDTRAVLARHQLSARSYSPTALQHFAACPYRFYLQAVNRLEPREEAEVIDVLDPLTRGALFHEIQFDILTLLREEKLLPVSSGNLHEALAKLDAAVDRVAARWREDLAPAIERVWRDGIDEIRADLREWLRRASSDSEHWTPERFELAFGLDRRAQADPASSPNAVVLANGLRLRGSIDLVERDAAGKLRATDHKTGRVRADKDLVIGGGGTLQPVLYALAAEQILGEPVRTGRLYYCTAAGGYEERIVEVDDRARAALDALVAAVGEALAKGFLPAAPREGECEWCDYRRVCGPYEEQRSQIKPAQRLGALTRLRAMR
ncbi:MAG: PD-(D/E)XK nuclease family protein, partial [Candidatus Binataceae bacterium]